MLYSPWIQTRIIKDIVIKNLKFPSDFPPQQQNESLPSRPQSKICYFQEVSFTWEFRFAYLASETMVNSAKKYWTVTFRNRNSNQILFETTRRFLSVNVSNNYCHYLKGCSVNIKLRFDFSTGNSIDEISKNSFHIRPTLVVKLIFVQNHLLKPFSHCLKNNFLNAKRLSVT